MSSETRTTPSQSEVSDVNTSLANLTVSPDQHSDVLKPPEEVPNPWEDTGLKLPGLSASNPVNLNDSDLDHIIASPTPTADKTFLPNTTEVAPSSESIQPTVKQDGEAAGKEAERTKQEILDEFDPFASHEEKAAKEAWESSQSHPPPLPPPPETHEPSSQSTQVPTVLPPQPVEPPSRTSSPIPAAFPALAALARTFALPSLGGHRSRPRSLDTAASVPSPTTISSFATQQAHPPKSAPPYDSTALNAADASSGTNSGGRSTPTTRPSSRTSRDGDAPPFDFQKFLDQMKLRQAEPVAKYLRSFLSNFAKRTFTVGDQVKLINDFLNFIAQRMRESEIWKNISDAEFDNAMEGMEKLVMNRLYDFTFTPQVARMIPPRPITSDDLERDRVLSQRIALFTWIRPEHLDVPEGEGSEGFLMFGQQELLKINHYKAPRDKLICILNCCKVIFGLIRHLQKEEGADSFVPILIYIVIKANPEHLLSNVEFINRFRNPAKLQSEAGYYLSSLMGAVSFIETMDHTSLSNITQEQFEKNVEDAIASLPSSSSSGSPVSEYSNIPLTNSNTSIPLPSSHTGEESAEPLALPTMTPSQQTISEDARRFLQKTGDTISKPLNALGKIFNEVLDNAEESLSSLPSPFAPLELGRDSREGEGMSPQTPAGYGEGGQIQTPYRPRIRRNPSSTSVPSSQYGSPAGYGYDESPTRRPGPGPTAGGPYQNIPQQPRVQALSQSERDLQQMQRANNLSPYSSSSYQSVSRTPTPALDFSSIQEEIDRAHENVRSAAKETLRQIFPTVDEEVVDWVLEANENDLGKSIEALLEMSSGT
ncbi:hypothetical protein C8Q75DRAFT_719199 [Abortiporus biennis]|nr:hypothetical protein C8Q75DRAFT_719199 [Abortiporus biennis]